jgi:hypothetical protein
LFSWPRIRGTYLSTLLYVITLIEGGGKTERKKKSKVQQVNGF